MVLLYSSILTVDPMYVPMSFIMHSVYMQRVSLVYENGLSNRLFTHVACVIMLCNGL